MAKVQHAKVWESLLVAGGIIFAFGIIWGAFLMAKRFTEAQGAIVLVVIGIILLVLSESLLITAKKKKSSVQHAKVWESLLISGGIVFAFGVIWGAFLMAKAFTETQGAIVLIVIGIIVLVIAESVLISVKPTK